MTTQAKESILKYAENERKHCMKLREEIEEFDIPEDAKNIIRTNNEIKLGISLEIIKELEND